MLLSVIQEKAHNQIGKILGKKGVRKSVRERNRRESTYFVKTVFYRYFKNFNFLFRVKINNKVQSILVD